MMRLIDTFNITHKHTTTNIYIYITQKHVLQIIAKLMVKYLLETDTRRKTLNHKRFI